ncbi:ABC transporter permease subunit [Clostridium gasigenes]|uniref:ABC transporter permease subunit n=1 Tax=Clostridium gasigenes TaxID=94869 RepID=UPI001C0D265E|nr:ABC transporter permease subunit [Clostridium gasigenes]MBU3108732.1 ABC transporter permease subunit [Clostridium gasigenes]
MYRLIKAELFKLFKNKTFKVLCIVAIILSIIVIAMTSIITEDFLLKALGDIPQEQKVIQLEQIRGASSEAIFTPGQLGFHVSGAKDMFNITTIELFHTAFGVGAIEILIGVLVAAFLAKEYSEGTIKNILAYGKKREHYYIAKWIAITVAAAIIMAITVGLATIINIIINGWGEPFKIIQLMGMLKTFGAAVIVNSAVVAIIMLIATLVKSNGATIGISVAIFVGIPLFTSFLYGKIDWFDNLYELTLLYNVAIVTAISANSTDVIKAIMISLVTLVAALGCGIAVFNKQDIK